MKTETLSFKIGISGTYWDRRPKYQVLLDDEVIAEDEIKENSGTVEYVEFSRTVPEGIHTISLRFLNKTSDQTVKAPESTEDNLVIAKDMLLNLHTIEVDGVDVPVGSEFGATAQYGVYKLDEAVASYQGRENVTELPGTKNMGWNGRYEFTIESPFYIWLLENL